MVSHEFGAPAHSLEQPPARPDRRPRQAAALFAGWTLYGLALAGLFAIVPSPAAPTPIFRAPFVHQLVLSLVPSWIWAVWTPLVVRATRRADARLAAAGRDRRWTDLLAAGAIHLRVVLGVLAATTLGRAIVNQFFESPYPAAASFAYWLDHNLFTYVVLATVAHALDLHRRWVARARRELALQAELAGAKLQFLRRQLQPHFLFNTLNAVAELTREDPPRASRMLRHLQRLLRSAIARSDAEEVALHDELATLEPYLELQRMRFGDTLDVVRRVDPAVLDARVPTFVLQPLVENAVQHGLGARHGGGTLEVCAEAHDGMLRLEVRDDGPGPRLREGRGRGGIGLRNTRARLAQLYGEAASLTLEERATGGTAAIITLPLRPITRPSGAWDVVDEEALAAPSRETARAAAGVSRFLPEPPDEDEALPQLTLTGEMPLPAPLPPPPRRFSAPARILLLWTSVGALWMLQRVLLQKALGRPLSNGLFEPTVELWSAMLWALLTPFVLAAAARVRIRRRGWRRAGALHVALGVGVAIVHLWAVLAFAHLAHVHTRPLLHTLNVRPFTLDLLVYAFIVTWSHGRELSRWHRLRVLSQARLDTALARARWQALALELRPEFLLAVLDRIAQLAPADPPRAERLVERLADYLRSLLDTVGRPQQPLRDELALLHESLALWAEATRREVRLAVELPPPALDRPVSAGAFRSLTNAVVAQEQGAGDRVSLHIGMAPRAGRLALLLESSVPIRPDTNGEPLPYELMGADFPDLRTAVLDLGPLDDPGALAVRASSPVIATSG